ncbi:MAG TPA: glycosyltransferase [Bacteroidia bacterium]|nr:glycosyltransferase [Bacteroidia bacterium]
MSKEKINIHLYPSPITNESRMLKITHSLAKENYFDKIYLVGIVESGLLEMERIDDKIKIVRIKRIFASDNFGFLGKVFKTLEWSARIIYFAMGKEISCINCHSLPVLPICVFLKWIKKAKLIYDTHELETETVAMHGIRKKLMKNLERVLIKYVDSIVVVSGQISNWYAENYKIVQPIVVRNIPYKRNFNDEKSTILRNRFQIKSGELIFLTSGILDTGRGVERLLNVFSKCDATKHIVFMGNGPLESRIKEMSLKKKNIHFLPAVKPELVQEYVAGADVGFCLIENLCLSYYYSLPNKLFEYIMAGLPVCINNLPEQKSIIEKYSCGWIASEDDNEFINFIQHLTIENLEPMKKNIFNARQNLGWHNEEKILLKMFDKMFGK